jgi:thioredoxin-related protein
MMRPFAAVFLCLALVAPVFPAVPEYRSMGADVFDPKTPAEKLIADAMTQAKRDSKRVLLLFGANWCPWCRRLHAALSKDPAVQARLHDKFVLVYVDANTRNDKQRNAAVMEKYGNPTLQHGLPVFVIVDDEGRQIGTRETASLAADTDAKVAARVLAFLNEWAK